MHLWPPVKWLVHTVSVPLKLHRSQGTRGLFQRSWSTCLGTPWTWCQPITYSNHTHLNTHFHNSRWQSAYNTFLCSLVGNPQSMGRACKLCAIW
ncbi:hypothetical protein Q7C36_015175 [Tachysurus vachellii]|uniref:Uncharacterized protein n=1 Tax=Tachysurus vachellii TaxID=175792 RepID=A0AA88MDF1_TACVA|nr:hypothetical protein Q7C36_015175 [Tachysurus vachellii]